MGDDASDAPLQLHVDGQSCISSVWRDMGHLHIRRLHTQEERHGEYEHHRARHHEEPDHRARHHEEPDHSIKLESISMCMLKRASHLSFAQMPHPIVWFLFCIVLNWVRHLSEAQMTSPLQHTH